VDRWERLAALGAAGVLGASFLEWYGVSWAVLVDGRTGTDHASANAWTASTAWSVAVALSVGTAAWWLRYRRHPGPAGRGTGPVDPSVDRRTVAALAVALALLTLPWLGALPSTVVSTSRYEVSAYAGAAAPVGAIGRDDIFIYHEPGYYDADVGYGLYLALVAMLLVLGAVLAAGGGVNRSARRPAP
jgi:hypothetical protein